MSSGAENTDHVGANAQGVMPAEDNAVHARSPRGEPSSQAEARLRAHAAQLEARLLEVTHCLEQAEQRSAEVLTLRDQLQRYENALRAAEQKHVALTNTRSWRLTEPLRSGMGWSRRVLGR